MAARGSHPRPPRHEARERALLLLYEAELKKIPAGDVLASLAVAPDPFVTELVRGVATHLAALDEMVAEAAVDWELDRMAVVDRNILRLAAFELLEHTQTPVAVVIDEAVELAKRYSTDQSGPFVNGVLATIARRLRP